MCIRDRGAGEEPFGLRPQGRAPGVREGLHHIPAGAHVRALVRPLDAVGVPDRVHGDHRLLVREQDPLALFGGQLPPRPVHVVPERVEDVPQVLALPGARPGGDRALADRQRGVGDQRLLGRTVHLPEPVALRAGTGRRVGREGVGVEPLGAGRVGAGPGEQHAQGVGEVGDGADGGARGGRRAALLERDGRRQTGDLPDLRRSDLVDQAARVRRDRLEVAPLRLRVDRAERQRRLARAGHAGEHGQHVPGDVDVHALEVVLAGSSDADVRVVGAVGVVHGKRL